MKLSSLLNPRFIKIGVTAKSSEELIRKLIKDFSREKGWDEEKIFRLVMEREKQGPTVEGGVSIPHARIEGFKDLFIAIAIPREPIKVNGENVKIFFLILTSKTASRLYLNTLSAIAKLAKNKEILEKIVSSQEPDEIVKIIQDSGILVKEELTVKDIMLTDFPKVSLETPLKEIIDLFLEKNLNYLPVTEEGKLCGEITLQNILKVGIPHYVLTMVHVKFLKSFEPLETLLEKEEILKAKDIMQKVEIFFKPDNYLVEAAVQLVKREREVAPVVENSKLVGLLTLTELLRKILRA